MLVKYVLLGLILSLSYFNFFNVNAAVNDGDILQSYRREYDNYRPSMFKYYIGIDTSYSVIDYKLKDIENTFGNHFFSGKFILGTDVDNLFKLGIFYQYAPYHFGSAVTSPTTGRIVNSFSNFGLDISPYVKLNKYFNFITSIGVFRQKIKGIFPSGKVIKSEGNGFKIGVGTVVHLNTNIDVTIMYNHLLFTGYSDMSSVYAPSIGFIINF